MIRIKSETPFTWLDGEPHRDLIVNTCAIAFTYKFDNFDPFFIAEFLSQYLRKVTTSVMSNSECQSVFGNAAVTDSDICSRGTNIAGICSVIKSKYSQQK